MFAELKNKELHLYGKTAELNAVARSIHKGRHGASASFDLYSSISLFSKLYTKCHGKLATIEIKESEIYITYSESVKNHLYTYLSMPCDTQPGALFSLTHSSRDDPPLLADSSLELVIHIISSET
ncbi:hypothetical protein [Pseudomonas sp. WAC2]|uniref:hypothetical protein n=1 Tax=Pseudomonas sp. WAC2 TaxID=3055057 RepID=UPI0025AFE362|nr:hypothetical protein [Pseudomonas sp. WAC2]MDN3238039.1 hypothetical protein [Pseudomonas sp. WAC2]